MLKMTDEEKEEAVKAYKASLEDAKRRSRGAPSSGGSAAFTTINRDSTVTTAPTVAVLAPAVLRQRVPRAKPRRQ